MDSIETGTGTGNIGAGDSGLWRVEELGSVFVDALLDVVAKVSGFSFGVMPSLSGEENDFDGMIGIMSFNSNKKDIMIFLSAEENDMRVICSYMSGIAQEEVTKDDMYDALCELVNMTAGTVKLRIGGEDYIFTLSVPFAVNGDNISIITKTRVNVFSRILGTDEISVRLKIVY